MLGLTRVWRAYAILTGRKQGRVAIGIWVGALCLFSWATVEDYLSPFRFRGRIEILPQDGLSFGVLCVGILYALFERSKSPELFYTDPDTGERYRITYKSRHGSLYDTQSSWEQRTTAALLGKQKRRRKFFTALLIGVGSYALLQWGLGRPSTMSGSAMMADAFGGVGLLYAALIGGAALLKELAYQSGTQWIKGAKVLDERPVARGMDQVKEQAAYGSAKVATEAETNEFLNRSDVTKSPIHEQEFEN